MLNSGAEVWEFIYLFHFVVVVFDSRMLFNVLIHHVGFLQIDGQTELSAGFWKIVHESLQFSSDCATSAEVPVFQREMAGNRKLLYEVTFETVFVYERQGIKLIFWTCILLTSNDIP